jgi:hypothetical protein
MTLSKHKANLNVSGNNVYSYNTHVATINHEKETVKRLGYWSVTTSKHINYVASEYGYKVVG